MLVKKCKADKASATLLRLLFYAALATAFLLLFSCSTSPLTKEYVGDSAFFLLVGNGMTKGMLPYRDFFDMKGPYLFFFEFLGQLIAPGRIGSFIVQWVSLFASLCITDKIYRCSLGGAYRKFATYILLGFLPWLFFAVGTFEGGNLTEELSLPWLLSSLYFVLDWLYADERSENYRHSPKAGFFYGLVFGILSLVRINNAALIGAILFTVSLSLIYKKQFKNLFLNAVAFLLGFVVSFTPMLAFYAYHGILQEMLSQVFLFGVCYSSEIGFAEKLYNLITINFSYILIMLLPVVVLFVFRVKSRRYWLLSFSAFALTLVACAMGNGYVHYFALIIPNIILAAALLFRFMPQKTVFSMLKTKRKKIIAVSLSMILLAIGCVQPCKQSVDWVVNNLSRIAVANFVSERPRFRYVREIKSYIPEDDYDSVYAYDIRCSSWYAQTGIFPANKYCDWQAHYIELQPEIGDELAKWISEKSVKWIVLPADKEVEPPQIAQAIKENYSVYAENEAYILMRSNG